MKDRNTVNKNVCLVIYAKGLSFNLVTSPCFKKAMESAGNFGKDYVPQSYHEAKVTNLQ